MYILVIAWAFECHTLVIGKREAHEITNFIAHHCNCTHALSVVANFCMLVSTMPYVPYISTTIFMYPCWH